MRKIQCHECGKRYDFDADDFCPRCGAFTQPPRRTRIGADGTVVRVDGINEANHQNSFVHAELHEENRKRKGTQLEDGTRRKPRAAAKQTAFQKGGNSGKKPAGLLVWIIFAIIALNVLSSLLSIIF